MNRGNLGEEEENEVRRSREGSVHKLREWRSWVPKGPEASRAWLENQSLQLFHWVFPGKGGVEGGGGYGECL
jgi:hypothetical protein